MPKLSEIKLDENRFKGQGLRPWNTAEKSQTSTGSKEVANQASTGSKEVANQASTGSKEVANQASTGSKEVANQASTGSKEVANQASTGSKEVANQASTGSKEVANQASTGSKEVANQASTGSKEVANQASTGSKEVANQASTGSKEVANQASTGSKEVANQASTGSKEVANQASTGSKEVANQASTGSKEVANQASTGSKEVANQASTGSKEVANQASTGSKEVANQASIGNMGRKNKASVKPINSRSTNKPKLESLKGLQLDLLVWLKTRISKEGESYIVINIKEAAKALNTSGATAKNALLRLIKKGFVKRIPGVLGKYGVTRIILPKVVIDFLKSVNIERPYIYNSNNNTITKIEENTNSLDHRSEWQELNIEPLADIGFKKSHVKQLEKLSTPEIVQESINHFAYALEHNAKVKKYDSPINVFMGVMRKGGAWIEAGYRSPHELAMEKILEARKLEKNRIKKLHEQETEMNFQDWLNQLSQGDREALLEDYKAPKAASKPVRDRAEELFLFNYFKAEHGESIDD